MQADNNAPKFSVGDVVEIVELPGYKHDGKRGKIVRLKRIEGEDYADVHLDKELRAIEFMTLHLKRIDSVQGSLFTT